MANFLKLVEHGLHIESHLAQLNLIAVLIGFQNGVFGTDPAFGVANAAWINYMHPINAALGLPVGVPHTNQIGIMANEPRRQILIGRFWIQSLNTIVIARPAWWYLPGFTCCYGTKLEGKITILGPP